MEVDAFDDVSISLRTSLTREEAATRLLGYGRSAVSKMDSSDQELTADYIVDLRTYAQAELYRAIDEGAPDDVLLEKEDTVLACNELAEKLAVALAAVDDELAKGKKSALRTDRHATKETGVLHFTIRSIDEWNAAAKPLRAFILPVAPAAKKPRTVMLDRGELILEAIVQAGFRPQVLPVQKNGTRGVKANIRQSLKQHPLFAGNKTAFDKSWEHLREIGAIADGDTLP